MNRGKKTVLYPACVDMKQYNRLLRKEDEEKEEVR